MPQFKKRFLSAFSFPLKISFWGGSFLLPAQNFLKKENLFYSGKKFPR